jgi:hypothetical protein
LEHALKQLLVFADDLEGWQRDRRRYLESAGLLSRRR